MDEFAMDEVPPAPQTDAAPEGGFDAPWDAPPAVTDEAPPAVPEPTMSMMDVSAPPPVVGGDSNLAKFQEETRLALEKRDAEADKAHQEVREKAAATVQKLSSERDNKIAERKAQNFENEKTVKARNEALFKDGPIWDRVGSLVDVKDDKLARKTQRMKEILTHLQSTQ